MTHKLSKSDYEMTAEATQAQADLRAWRKEGEELTGEALGWHLAALQLEQRASSHSDARCRDALRLAASSLRDNAIRVASKVPK